MLVKNFNQILGRTNRNDDCKLAVKKKNLKLVFSFFDKTVNYFLFNIHNMIGQKSGKKRFIWKKVLKN